MRFRAGSATRRAIVAAALSTGLLTAGCAGASPAVVAYVGDAKITQQQVETAVAAVSTTVEEGQTVSQEAVVNAMIQGELANQIGAERKIAITDAQRDTFLKTTNLAPLLGVASAKPIAYDVADTQIVSTKLGGEAYLAEIERRSVTLNPRYGVLDPKQKTIVTDRSGSLSEPAAPQTP
jgi:hypothetical protein